MSLHSPEARLVSLKGVMDSHFYGNAASLFGGSISVTEHTGVIIQNCVFESDSSDQGASVYIGFGPQGGGISVLISDSHFSGNSAMQSGGAILFYNSGPLVVVDSITVTNCSALMDGGAISMQLSQKVFISKSVFADNSVTGNGGAISCDSYADLIGLVESVLIRNMANIGGCLYVVNLGANMTLTTF